MDIYYNKTIEKRILEHLNAPIYSNQLEVSGVKMLVTTMINEETLEFEIRVTDDTAKVLLFLQQIDADYAIETGFLATKTDYDNYVVDLAKTVILPMFEKKGVDRVKQEILEELIEWERVWGAD